MEYVTRSLLRLHLENTCRTPRELAISTSNPSLVILPVLVASKARSLRSNLLKVVGQPTEEGPSNLVMFELIS